MKKARNLIFAGVLLLAGVTAVLLIGNWPQLALEVTSGEFPAIKADLEAGNISLSEEKEGVIVWELKAKIAERYQDRNMTLVKDLRATLHAEDGGVVKVRGDRGQFNDETRDMVVEGDVLVTSEGGLSLQTDTLRYDHRQRQIRTEAPVKIEGRGLSISGLGLVMDLETERISILRQVETAIREIPVESS